jgi:LPXTG-motif cell wall-anchored protein
VRALRIPIVGAVLAAVALAASLPIGTQAQQTVSLTISEQNDSDISGTATLTAMGDQTQVVVQLQNAPGPHPIHIHEGTCANLDPAVEFPLTTVMNGRSETMVAASLQHIQAMQHAINVHKSPQEASVYVACGTIPTAGAAAPAAQPKPGEPMPKPAPPATKPGEPATKPAPATKPGEAMPKPAPAQAPSKPTGQPPAALPRTGDAENTPLVILVSLAGLALVGAGAFAIQRRRSA